MNVTLSNDDIAQLLRGRTKVIHYADLQHYDSIEQLLSPYGNAVILYPGQGNVGHWTCVLYTKDGRGRRVVEFFDPYGISVDREFQMVHPSVRRPRFLARLLYETPYPVEFNDHDLQVLAAGVNTCGRHVVNRIRNAHMPLDTYIYVFGGRKKGEADRLAVEMTDMKL